MASGSASTPDGPTEVDDDDGADLPLTMAASVVLDHLPKDAHKALETAGELEVAKGINFAIFSTDCCLLTLLSCHCSDGTLHASEQYTTAPPTTLQVF